LRDVSDDCLKALLKQNHPPYLFARGGVPVYIVADEDGRHKIATVTPTYLGSCLTEVADFFQTGDNYERPVNPPVRAINNLLVRPIAEWGLPTVVAVTETPTLRPDGSVVDVPGYDSSTKVVYSPCSTLRIPRIPVNPSPQELCRAVAQIEDAIGQFPFRDKASRTNAYGMLLTPIVRPVIRGCVPVALVDANNPGTGKGLLTEVLSILHTGSPAAMKAAPQDKDEWRKALTSVIRSGNALTIFDNLDDTLKSPYLAQAVTSEIWTDRILGITEDALLHQRTVFIVSGNNIALGGDLPRRCYWIRMDANMPRPWLGRSFRHADLKGWVSDNRGRLLAALLTMGPRMVCRGPAGGEH